MATKQLNKCYDWWESLTEEEQLKIMTDYYPIDITTEVHKDTDIDKMFGDMPDYTQLWIYQRETKRKIIPVNPDKFDQILKKIGRKKL